MIRVDGLWADYGAAPVLRGVNLCVASGEFVGILGPNACGKSTLLRVLCGSLPASRGQVHLDGSAVATTHPREIARRVAVVPQSTEIPFPFTGYEVVMMGRFPHRGRFARETEEDHCAVADAMADTDTRDLSGRLITQVSGGERQRLVLARSLAQQTPLMLLDEATAAMDVHRKIDAFDLLARRNAAGTTVLAVMHDLNLAALYCERLLFLLAGEVFADGPTREVFTAATIRAVYDTPVEVSEHAVTGRPFAVFLRRQ